MQRRQVHGGGDLEPGRVPALRSQLAWAVLGLVIETPSHGYEIGQRFELRFGSFMRAGRSSIYATLNALSDGGLIEKMPGPSPTGVSRGAKAGASYRATARGARAYRGWLAEQVRHDPLRVEMLGRMTLAGVQSVDDALDFVDRYEAECMLEARQLPRPHEAVDASELSDVVGDLLIEEHRQIVNAQMDWIVYARAKLGALRNGATGGSERT